MHTSIMHSADNPICFSKHTCKHVQLKHVVFQIVSDFVQNPFNISNDSNFMKDVNAFI